MREIKSGSLQPLAQNGVEASGVIRAEAGGNAGYWASFHANDDREILSVHEIRGGVVVGNISMSLSTRSNVMQVSVSHDYGNKESFTVKAPINRLLDTSAMIDVTIAAKKKLEKGYAPELLKANSDKDLPMHKANCVADKYRALNEGMKALEGLDAAAKLGIERLSKNVHAERSALASNVMTTTIGIGG